MALKCFGAYGKLRLLPDTFSLKRKRQGLTVGSGTYEVYFRAPPSAATMQEAVALFPKIGSSHPFTASDVYLEEYELKFGPCGVQQICQYAGVDDGDFDQPVYDLAVGMEEEPIETHPFFVEKIGGKPSAPIHGAQFVDASGKITGNDFVGTFAGFTTMVPIAGTPPTVDVNEWAGIESYLDAGSITYREQYMTRSLPDDAGFYDYAIGHVYNTLPGPNPSFKRRNWLYLGYTFRERGRRFSSGPTPDTRRAVYELTREWRLSGRRGWNKEIYNIDV
jgi:hypothetical protein